MVGVKGAFVSVKSLSLSRTEPDVCLSQSWPGWRKNRLTPNQRRGLASDVVLASLSLPTRSEPGSACKRAADEAGCRRQMIGGLTVVGDGVSCQQLLLLLAVRSMRSGKAVQHFHAN